MTQERRPETGAQVDEWRGEKSKKRLKCCADATSHMKQYNKEFKEKLSQGEPVVWKYIGIPPEIFNAMDILNYDMQHYSALCSAKQMSRYYLDTLNLKGYFRDLCRYCTVPLGYAFDKKPEIAPWGGLPKFTALVTVHLDDPAMPIWELYARELNIPMYFVDRPYIGITRHLTKPYWEDFPEHWQEAIEPHRIDLMVEEYEGLVRFLETVTGRNFSETKLREVLDNQNQVNEYYYKASILETNIPCPITWVDELGNTPIALYFNGDVALNHARKYYEEIKERVDSGQAAVPNEKVRLWWNGHPPWFSLGFFNTWEEKYGAVFLPMWYLAMREARIWHDVSNPLRVLAGVAAAGLPYPLIRTPTTRIHNDFYLIEKYKVDGVVFLTVESCKLLYAGILFTREALEKAGVPTLEINADMVDARDWDDTKMKSLVTSFIETLMP